MSNRSLNIADPRSDAAAAKMDLLLLNRQITAATVAELTTGGLSPELAAIIEARDLIRARLSSLEGAKDG